MTRNEKTLFLLKILLRWSEAYKKSRFHAFLFRLKNRKYMTGFRDNSGVCYFMWIENCSLNREIVRKVSQTDHMEYPVKSSKGDGSVEEFHNSNSKEKWGDHPYAENRRKFIRDYIRELEREIENEK